MLIESISDSIARKSEVIKSIHAIRFNESYAANAHAVAMPLEKSAKTERKTVLTTLRLIRRL